MRNRLAVSIFALLALGASPSGAGGGKPAFWRSLLVPGWGQRYVGREAAGARFFAAELLLWGGYFAFLRVEDLREDEYQRYAAEHARARTAGKSDTFFDDLGFYESRLQHDQFARYEEGPEADLYPDDPDFFWEWDRRASRLRYRELRNASERAHRRALYATGLIFVNHLISAVHAARVPGGRHLAAEIDPRSLSFEVRLVRRFR